MSHHSVERRPIKSESIRSRSILSLLAHPSRFTQPSHVYLQEDGLEMWSVLLKRSSALSPEMLSLLPQLVALIAAGTDVVPQCLRILESYLLLDAVIVMQVSRLGRPLRSDRSPSLGDQLCAVDLFTAFEGLLGELKLEAVKVILHALSIAFQTSSIQTWAGALDSSAAFVKLLTPLSRSETPVLVVTKCECENELAARALTGIESQTSAAWQGSS